jgi:hypothetical protein
VGSEEGAIMNYESLAKNRALAWIGRPAIRFIHAVDPTRLRLRGFRGGVIPEAGFVCIYRKKYSPCVVKVVRQALALKMAVALWALDSPVSGLVEHTVGCGPGSRLRLLNYVCNALPASASGQIVICDDDVIFARGGLGELLRLSKVCGFGIAQPAHAPRSYINHGITRARPLTLARVTTFVESGPVVVISSEWRSSVLPFPEEFGMGWGLDLIWADLQKRGCRLGIVDGVSLRHLSPAAGGYEIGPEGERLRMMMEARSIESLVALQRTAGAWRVWQREPPWSQMARTVAIRGDDL